MLEFAHVWCIVGYKNTSEYVSQVSNELSVGVMARSKERGKASIEEMIQQLTWLIHTAEQSSRSPCDGQKSRNMVPL